MPAGTVVIADMNTGPIVLGCVPYPPLSDEVMAGIAQALGQDNNGRPVGLWVLEACPIRHEAITVRTGVIGAG